MKSDNRFIKFLCINTIYLLYYIIIYNKYKYITSVQMNPQTKLDDLDVLLLIFLMAKLSIIKFFMCSPVL